MDEHEGPSRDRSLPAEFSPATVDWFQSAFASPTQAQRGAWDAIASGQDTLVVAPTGSGKTLAAFLSALDRLAAGEPPPEPLARCRVLYVSPLKALAVDVERNLRSPLTGIRRSATRLGLPPPSVEVAVRSGDTDAQERRRLARRPPDILITTPESLFLLLTSAARAALAGVQTVIVDEIHALAGTKRGAHLALSLERLDALLPARAQRIGLSATVRPTERVAAFLSGGGAQAPARVVRDDGAKTFELRVEVPVADMGDLTSAAAPPEDPPREREPDAHGDDAPDQVARPPSIWPHVEARVLDLVEQHRSTLVFANSRRLAERLTGRLNDLAAERAAQSAGADPGSSAVDEVAQVARAHHGSVSKEQRATIEDDLKRGRLPAVVATSSLELGIDMGAVDLVVQVEAPPSVASGLQRVGRAGHQVGAVSRGVFFPKYRGDLLASAVVVDRMRRGLIEELEVPQNPLDVLAQHVVAAVSMDDWPVDELLALARRAMPFSTLPQSGFDAVLDLLSGRYPSDEFAELRPRLVWDRDAAVLRSRPGAQRLAVTSGGTIPDRGLFGVFIVGEAGARVGELDEEMVYESRLGDVFALGATSWRIEDITHDRVLVSPAPGQPGKMPFWHGDALGRPAELGAALGAYVRETAETARTDPAAATARTREAGLDPRASQNLLAYLEEQRQATGVIPDDRTVLMEHFRDELGDWRLVVHSPYGARVHAPWALAVGARLRERFGVDVQTAHGDDGMIFRIPDTLDDTGPGPDLGGGPVRSGSEELLALLCVPSEEIEELVTAEVGGSALFAARFRECAARALLLPRRDPGRRAPLWQQRQRSAQLLAVAAQHGSFPILLETMRECLQDVYDLPALRRLLTGVERSEIRVESVHTTEPSPFARSLLFGYVAQFMYEGDSPLAERRAQALTLDATLLAELLGRAELRELLDEDVLASTELDLQRRSTSRQARTPEQVADLVRLLGPLSQEAVTQRCADPGVAESALAELERDRRIMAVRVTSELRWAVVEDAARLRDALGCALPVGLPEAFLEPVTDPLGDLVRRYSRTHGPFDATGPATWLGLPVAVVVEVLRRLTAQGRLTEGEFRPGRSGTEWCDPEVLRLLRRRSVAALRAEAEPVDAHTFAAFLPEWQQVGSRRRGPDALLAVVEQLAGYPVPASALESLVLPARLGGYEPAWLDELTTAGEVLWSGHGRLPGNDGWISLHVAEDAPLTLPVPEDGLAVSARAVLEAVPEGAAVFASQLGEVLEAAGSQDNPGLSDPSTRLDLAPLLWTLVWDGWLTNDTLAPLRALVAGRSRRAAQTGGARARAVGSRARSRQRFGRRRLASATPSSRSSTDPTLGGRWSRVPVAESDPTTRAHATATVLLDRYGIVTRGSTLSEHVPGGFAATYRVLAAVEESGQCRRGYVVAGLGGAQFALPGAVDRLRARSTGEASGSEGLVLAATDPGNAYGAALAWPEASTAGEASAPPSAHRPGRRVGAVVVLVAGRLVLYVERGGRTLLSFSEDAADLRAGAYALASAVRAGNLGRLTVQKADGAPVTSGAVGEALSSAGFQLTPRGLRLRPT